MITTMYSYTWKKWGLIVSCIGLILMIAERITGLIIFKQLNTDQHYSIFEFLMLLGLVTVMYSKEKIDDDRAKFIRLKSMQIAFMAVLSLTLSMGLSNIIVAKETIETRVFFMIASLGIILYLLLFHLGLYFDFLVEYEDLTVGDSLSYTGKPRWGMLAYFAAAAVTIVLMCFL